MIKLVKICLLFLSFTSLAQSQQDSINNDCELTRNKLNGALVDSRFNAFIIERVIRGAILNNKSTENKSIDLINKIIAHENNFHQKILNS